MHFLRNQGSTAQQEQANNLEPSRSLFALTLTAMCRNPRDFYGQDILGKKKVSSASRLYTQR